MAQGLSECSHGLHFQGENAKWEISRPSLKDIYLAAPGRSFPLLIPESSMENTAKISTVTAIRSKTVLLATKAGKKRKKGKATTKGLSISPRCGSKCSSKYMQQSSTCDWAANQTSVFKTPALNTEHILNFVPLPCFWYQAKLSWNLLDLDNNIARLH